ncbi:MAG: hypothetical protein WC551_12575 [Patescibacteria group bacterium]
MGFKLFKLGQKETDDINRILEKVPSMSAPKLLECFMVEEDNRLLNGVLNVLMAVEEMAVENLEIPKMTDSERAYYAGKAGGAADAQERIIELVMKARKAKEETRKA